MTAHTGPTRLYRLPLLSSWWCTRKRTYLFVLRELTSVFVAWFVVYLLLLVYAVGQSEAATSASCSGRPAVGDPAQRRRSCLRAAARGDLVQSHPPGDGRAGGGPGVPSFHIVAGQYTGLVVVSGFVLWLVTR